MSGEINWGPEIAVEGKRPAWLRGVQACLMKTGAWCTWQPPTPRNPAEEWAWSHGDGRPNITAIRLPADHPHYATHNTPTAPSGGEVGPEVVPMVERMTVAEFHAFTVSLLGSVKEAGGDMLTALRDASVAGINARARSLEKGEAANG